MMRSGSVYRSAMGAVLCAMTLTSSVVPPLLERGAVPHGPTVESEHDPAACAPTHDHRLCTQVGANHALLASSQHHHAAHVFVDVAPPVEARHSDAKPLLQGPPSRAPPQA